jgi:tetratricopeptide (TPR) repeat protein
MGPLAGAVAVYLTLRWTALGGFAPSYGHHRYEASVSILAAVQLFGQYLGTLVLPEPLNAWHVFRPPASLLDPSVLFGLAACAALAGVAWLARRRPLPLVGLAWTVAPLLPVLYAPVLGEGVFAERYLYFPSFGFTLLLACGWTTLTARLHLSRKAVLAIPLVVVAMYGVGTVRRNPVWHDHLSLWSDTVRKSPESAVAREYLCFALYEAGRFVGAVESCRRSLALDPNRLDARINLGNALTAVGDVRGAARELDEALRRQPRSVHALTTRGLIYMATGQPDLALDAYRRALAFDPNNAEARNVLGVALARLGRVHEAVRELREAVRLAPDHPEYRENLRVLTTPPPPPGSAR